MGKLDAAARPLSAVERCRLCRCRLSPADPRDGVNDHLCEECRLHPAAKRPPAPPPEFTGADKALIDKTHGYMSAEQLLGVLNERLLADSPEATPHTMEQLHAALQVLEHQHPAGDWASLRKLIAQARRAGVLEKITAQTIADFAVVYALTPAQVLRLKDVILGTRSERAS
jgi:hypothetical protein